MALGPWQLAIIAVLVVVLFGRGKISGLMGDLGTGISEFKKGLKSASEQSVLEDTPPVSSPEDTRD